MIDLTDGVPGITAPPPRTYEQFWPLYLSNHLHPLTRVAHVVGDSATLLAAATLLCSREDASSRCSCCSPAKP